MTDLVLFEQAMLHITRTNRIIQHPGGNAMLIGVGGSGKESLCRLAAFNQLLRDHSDSFFPRELATRLNFVFSDACVFSHTLFTNYKSSI